MRKSLKNINVLEKAAEVFELTGEVLAGLPKITITGCRTVYIENHRGVLEYSDCLIAINGGKATVKINGSGLDIVCMNAKELAVIGQVSSVEFEM
jgi:sporulation protein YqfC